MSASARPSRWPPAAVRVPPRPRPPVALRSRGGAMTTTLNRRSFIKVSAYAGGGMLVALQLDPVELLAQGPGGPQADPQAWAFVTPHPDNKVTIDNKNPEIDHGKPNMLPTLIDDAIARDGARLTAE